MQELYDWLEFPEPMMDAKQIKMFNETILKNYESVEEMTSVAKDHEGNYLKNIKPKIIRLKHLPTFYNDILSMAFKICHHDFGLVTFPPNIWDGLLYNVYSGDTRGHYGQHSDLSRSWTYDSKMTFLLNLSPDEYEGGDLIVDKRLTNFRKPGSVILFKSNLMHEVTPVTKGERITLTYFINGPKFQ